jgi:hypothetical protein
MIAKQTPQANEHPLDLCLTAGHPQQDESHLSNGEETNALTGEDQAEGSLSHPEVLCRLLRWEVQHGEIDSPRTIESRHLSRGQEPPEMVKEWPVRQSTSSVLPSAQPPTARRAKDRYHTSLSRMTR